jgi:perosamine synthetase
LTTNIRIPVSQPCLSPLEHQLVNDCLQRNQLSQGPMVAQFESELAERIGVEHVVACSSGTTALHLALVGLGIGPGDEVLVPDLTFVATANAVRYTGAAPVLVDVLPTTWCIDPIDAARKVTPRTKAIIPVHLYGVIADMRALADLRLIVVEDAAEAFGAAYHDFSGPWSDCATFSWYANKVLTSMGEGGAVATNDYLLSEKLRALRGQGTWACDRRYYHALLGYNYRLTDVQAAFGVGQLSHLDEMLNARHRIVRHYFDNLVGYVHMQDPGEGSHTNAPWQFTFAVSAGLSRDDLAAYLLSHGIDTRPAFVPLHRLPMYAYPFGDDGRPLHGNGPLDDSRFPNASAIGDTTLSLPTYPDLSLSAVDEISELVLEWVGRARHASALAT